MSAQSSLSAQPTGLHDGLLREDLVTLRVLFGYKNKECDYTEPPAGLSVKLPQSFVRDVLFVAIDVDTGQGFEEIKEGQHFRVGVSVLDTRCLPALDRGKAQPTEQEFRQFIKAYQFAIGSKEYCRKAAEKFWHGQSEEILVSDVKSRIHELVTDRKVIFVIHGGADTDVKFLNNIGMANRALYTIDTVKVAQKHNHRRGRIGLEELLKVYKIDQGPNHVAGNDAYNALRAMLMLVADDSEHQKSQGMNRMSYALTEGLKKIALAMHREKRNGKQIPWRVRRRRTGDSGRSSLDTVGSGSEVCATPPSELSSTVPTPKVAND